MMKLTRSEFGRALQAEIDKGYDTKRIARWAYILYLDRREIEPSLVDDLLMIIIMEQGSEFEIPEAELRKLASDLQA